MSNSNTSTSAQAAGHPIARTGRLVELQEPVQPDRSSDSRPDLDEVVVDRASCHLCPVRSYRRTDAPSGSHQAQSTIQGDKASADRSRSLAVEVHWLIDLD